MLAPELPTSSPSSFASSPRQKLVRNAAGTAIWNTRKGGVSSGPAPQLPHRSRSGRSAVTGGGSKHSSQRALQPRHGGGSPGGGSVERWVRVSGGGKPNARRMRLSFVFLAPRAKSG